PAPRPAALADPARLHDEVEVAVAARALRAVPDLVGAATRAERQAKRVDDQRLAATGLAGEQVQARAEPHVGLRDQGQVADPELLQQPTFWEPGAGPNPACLRAAGKSSPAG